MTEPSGPLDFGWRLSGDREVAPLQVFSDNSHTWLQWSPGQPLPAILASQPEGDRVLAYTLQDPYTVIDGHWPALVFRAGPRQATARKRMHIAKGDVAPKGLAPTPGAGTGGVSQSAAQAQTQDAPPEALAVEVASRPAVAARRAVYAVTPDDIDLRRALARWTGLSGWRFQPEHWAVDVDIPISAGDAFGDDFVPAVQALMATTELSDRPLQPCFYSNQVVRVVSANEPCDRTTAPGAST